MEVVFVGISLAGIAYGLIAQHPRYKPDTPFTIFGVVTCVVGTFGVLGEVLSR